MEFSENYSLDDLIHHGIKGQKWGVIRKRLHKARKKIKRFKNTISFKKPKYETKSLKGYKKKSKRLSSKKLRKLSNDDLKKLNARLELEKKYKESTKPKSKRLLDALMVTSSIAGTAITLYKRGGELNDIRKAGSEWIKKKISMDGDW